MFVGRASKSEGRARARAALGQLLVALGLLASCSSESSEPATASANAAGLPEPTVPLRHLLLVTADTWRGDHSLAEQGGQRVTPTLDRLAKGGVVFTENSSVAAMTSPGVAGILTGLMPLRSGVLLNEHVLPLTVPTLPETLREAGFRTAAFVANPVLRPGLGFERGFDRYELVAPSPPAKKARAEAVTARALEWLAEQDPAGPRVFLWVHYMEPHGPYEPGAEALERFPVEHFGDAPQPLRLLAKNDPSGRDGIPGYQWNTEAFLRETDARSYLGRYAAEVWSFDRSVGVLVDALEQGGWRGPSDNTLLVFASDHGEALNGEHGFWFSHAHPPTEDQLHTPLLVCYPGASGERRDEPVSNLDLAPTIAALLDIAAATPTDGVDLTVGRASRPIVAQYAQHRMTRLGPYKWSRTTRADTGAKGRVDLSVDPLERGSAEFPDEVRSALAAEFDRQVRVQPLGDSASRFELDDEQRAELEALGYVESSDSE